MSNSVRRMVLIVAAAAAMSGTATAASAEQQALFYTYGGTAYGVAGDVVLRRPGLASNTLYDNKLEGESVSTDTVRVLAGYRAAPGGAINYITQTIDVYLNKRTTTLRGGTDAASLTAVRVDIRGALTTLVYFSLPTGVFSLDNSSTGDTRWSSYARVYHRSYSTDDAMYLSATSTTKLGYYYTRSSSSLTAWGEPSVASAFSPACARETSVNSYSAAHWSTC